MGADKPGLLQRGFGVRILKALQPEPLPGFGISIRIRQMSQDVLRAEQGSLHPAPYWLEGQGASS